MRLIGVFALFLLVGGEQTIHIGLKVTKMRFAVEKKIVGGGVRSHVLAIARFVGAVLGNVGSNPDGADFFFSCFLGQTSQFGSL